MKRTIFSLIFLTLLFLWLFFPKLSKAADFSFDYDVYYDVRETGMTRVRHEITLTNEVTDFYARNYTLTVLSQGLENITVSDPGGVITPLVTQGSGETTITVPFNVQVVGQGNKLPFTVAFDSPDITERKGRIWEIIIPGITKKEEIKSYNIHLSVPKSFGEAAYFTPLPNAEGFWTLTELAGGGVTAGYGKYQSFSFNLEYFLQNQSGKRETQEITLPPDTAYQTVVLSRLLPKPQNVLVDDDGNWLATYILEPEQRLAITAEGSADVYLTPQSKPVVLTNTQRIFYTQSQPFWEQTEEIKKLATELKTPKAIFDWVVETLSYDYERIEPGIKRLGAKVALNNRDRAACMEFSDLFIAAARAAGIPAREIHGFAYTNNSRLQPLSLVSDVLHAWPEYYDDTLMQWIPVDPTWADTTNGVDYFSKLDFNHLAFAILGVNSDYPYPAGSFKNESSGKDVFVNFKAEETSPEVAEHTTVFSEDALLAGGPSRATLTIENIGAVRVVSDIRVGGQLAATVGKSTVNVPPFGYEEIPVTFTAPFSLKAVTYPVTVTINGKETVHQMTAYPFYVVYAWPIGIGAVMLGLALVAIIVRRRGKN